MIYFDNAATSLVKPPAVAAAVGAALGAFGNPGRSFHTPSMEAAREVYGAREEMARLVGLSDPLRVAFTSSATEALNLAAEALLEKDDLVVVSVFEHNSVLRPLYLRGCRVKVLGCDDAGNLDYDALPGLLTPDIKATFFTHGSNVLGCVTDALGIHGLCRERGIPMVLDASQTLGSVPVTPDMGDVICFTGHKGLFGPQGTGGLIVPGDIKGFKIPKTGGTGHNSFDRLQPRAMPELFEAGTPNSHGLSGLRAGVRFINETGLARIHEREWALTKAFLEGVRGMMGLCIYGDAWGDAPGGRLPIVSLNVKGMDSAWVASLLWEKNGIAVRPGVHCAPLLHQRFNTASPGMVRFSFSYFNDENEIRTGLEAIRAMAEETESREE